jgi:hypothetical protein
MAVDLARVKLKTLGTNEQPPAGYVCLGEKWPAEGVSGRDRERVRKGIVTDNLDAYRHVRFEGDTRGNIYVHLAQAEAWLDSYRDVDAPTTHKKASTVVDDRPAASGSQMTAAVVALCEINNGIAVLGDTLRNLVAAVELLGEQQAKQHEPAGSWRDMNGESL